MRSVNVMLRFPGECVGQPVISDLVRDYGVQFNILHARIHPSEEGRMLAQVNGTDDQIEESLESLQRNGVDVFLPESSFIWQSQKCVHCGACAGICPSQAFSINETNHEVEFDISRCILCEMCIQVCFYGAILTAEEYIDWKGAAR